MVTMVIMAAMPIVVIAGTVEEVRSGKGQIVVTHTEAAAIAGVSFSTIRRLVELNQLTPYPERALGSPVYLLSDIEKIRDERRQRY